MRTADSLEKTLILWKIEGRKRGGEKRWDGWMASLTQWMWVYANSGRQWRTGKPGVLKFTWSQRFRHDLGTKQQQSEASSSGKQMPVHSHLPFTVSPPFLWTFLQSTETTLSASLSFTKPSLCHRKKLGLWVLTCSEATLVSDQYNLYSRIHIIWSYNKASAYSGM